MSSDRTNVVAGAATVPEGANTAPAQPDPATPDVSKLRLEKIREYLVESLEQGDALQANLGATSSDLMLMGFRLKEAIEKAMADSSAPLARFEQLMPAIEGYLKVTRQIDRLAQLDRRLTDARSADGDRPKPR
ncbi:MAG: hypothetical protein HQ567_07685 [Candidatus Nealsonbacteria bacterium]|nr:hypothetical protein [Candidatus Nealsonbacteria bacterium]